jgi:hypothetical protein
VFEDALMRLLVESDPVPNAVLEWMVSGGWRRPDFRCDAAFVADEWPHDQAGF